MDQTILDVRTGNGIVTPQSGLNWVRTISSGYTKESTSITVSDASGISVGEMLILFEANDPDFVWSPYGGTDLIRQPVIVTGVAGNVISFSPPLAWGFSASLNPRFSNYYYLPSSYIGLEDLTVTGESTSTFSNVWFDNTYASWIKNVKSMYAGNIHLLFTHTVRNEVRGCYIYETTSANDGYGVYAYELGNASAGNSGLLVEDNIFENMFFAVMMNNAMGSVVSYNYAKNMHTNSWSNGVPAYNTQHGPHGMMTLWEGNIGQGIQNDGYHGSGSHGTFFRNWFHGLSQYATNRKLIDLTHYSYYHNVVGNVLGDASWNPLSYELTGNPTYANTQTIYRLGYPNMGNNDPPIDPKTEATLLRHGNYDYYNKTTIWDPGIADHNIPASLYLTSKPSWWGNLSWPAIGPDLNPMVGLIPAQARYQGQSYPYGSGDTTPPNVSIISPASGQTVSGTITVSANASDNIAVVGVQFKLDGANLSLEDTTSPYSITWDTTSASNGSHTLTALARDAAGNQTTSSAVTVTVSNDTTPPAAPSGVTVN